MNQLRAALAVPAALMMLLVPLRAGLEAQGAGSRANAPKPEARVEALTASADALHAGLGLGKRLGRTLSIAALGTAAIAREEGGVDTRLEVTARFHLDPERRASVAVYAAGGAAALRRDHSEWSGALIALMGAEVGRARWLPFFEVGFGGGLRLVAGIRAR